MIARQKLLTIVIPFVLAAGAVPLQAQIVVKGCPTGFSGNKVDSYTAGTTTFEQTCLTGQFVGSQTYAVTLNSPIRQFNLSVQATAQGIIFSVPSSFVATLQNPLGDAVTVSVTGTGGPFSGSFAIAPPLTAGGPVFTGGVGNPIVAQLFQGGTAPFINGLGSGSNQPPGMDTFPQITPNWTGTPSQPGTFSFNTTTVDAWGNSINPSLAFYIVPVPTAGAVTPTGAAAESAAMNIVLTGSGFVASTTVLGAAQSATSVTWTPPVGAPVLIPILSVTANQITAAVPANLLLSTGYASITVTNPANTRNSSAALFAIYPSVTAISPSTRTVNSGPFTMDVTGTGFKSNSIVVLSNDNTLYPITFIDSRHLRFTAPNFAAPTTSYVYVLNSDETESLSSSGSLLTVSAAPTLISINPTTALQGAGPTPLTVSGNFPVSGLTIYFNGNALSTTVVNSGQLAATIPANLLLQSGVVPVWVQTSDGYRTPSRDFTITYTGPGVQLVPVSPLPGGVINTPYSVNITASGGLTPYIFSQVGGALPAGLRLTSDGLLSGTPTVTGTSTFTLAVTDAGRTVATRDYRLTILASPFILTTPPLPNVLLNQPLQFQFAASGGIAPYTFVEFGDLPPGTQMVPSGILGGAPTKLGNYSFRVFARDSEGSSVSQVYSILVAPAGVLITPPSPLPSGQVGVAYSSQLQVIGGTAPYTWSVTGLPAGLSLAAGTGLLNGTPQTAGTFTLSITVKDSAGTGVTQSYTLAVASSSLTIVTQSLPNGAVGSSYSALLQATGGNGAVTFTATGLPGGVSLTAGGTLSGTPTAAGSFNIVVTATDAQGLKATANFKIVIADKLVVNSTALSAVLGTAITPVTLTATGGTPPYQWQSSNLPAGLALSSAGVLSGTSTALGTYSFTVFVVDSSGALGSGTVQVVVGLPASPSVTITGLNATNGAATQPRVQVGLANPYPVNVTAKLTLTFVPDAGADDPAVQFSSGGRTTQLVIPAGSTGALTDTGLQTGTVAGTINVTVQLLAGTSDITPVPAPVRSTKVSPGPPVITSVTAARTAGGFTVVINGYATTRAVTSATYQFTGNGVTTIATSQLDTAVGSSFTTWYGSTASTLFGSQFSLTQPFTVNGDSTGIRSVAVTLTNALGSSQTVAANLQ